MVALTLIARSPLQFDYACEKGAQAASRVASTAPTDSSADPETPNKTFTIGIWEKPDYGHNTRIRESPIYGQWKESESLFQQTSLATPALRHSVPQSMAWRGLVDWESSGQLEGQVALPSFLSTKKDYVLARRTRQANKPVFRSLAEAYNTRDAKTEGQWGRNGQGDAQISQQMKGRST